MKRELTPGVMDLLSKLGESGNTEARRIYLAEDRYVIYTRAEEHMARMKDLLDISKDNPQQTKPDNFIIVGETSSGKTSLVKNFIRLYAAPVNDPDQPCAHLPALYVLFRAEPDEDRLYHWILDAMFAAYKEKDRPDKKYRMVVELIKRLDVRMLIFDEFHHILTATSVRQRRSLNTIKTLSTDLQIPMVATGIPEVFPLMRSDPQIHLRFETLALPRWQYPPKKNEFRQFLSGLEQDLPLVQPSDLASREIARFLYDHSEGLIGEAVKLVSRAARRAVGGEERVTLAGIKALKPVAPSQRDVETQRELYGRVESDTKKPDGAKKPDDATS
ncbi:TniB family NTP-binding protein [Deinococcus sp.]|uniref:TniB family NTP-binding protein n=1 Tax=Deinococcus sp. TaxID=47478 RepID=UPI0025E1CBF1|nr:TniB family NTP-binding protein [Deinococcus sp.]